MSNNEIFFNEKYAIISYNQRNNWIEIDWIGSQSLSTIQITCNKALELAKIKYRKKGLNINANLKGMLTSTNEWINNDWLPRARRIGVCTFGYAYSPDISEQFLPIYLGNLP